MKYIRKSVEPELLARWKSAHQGATYKDLCNFGDAAAMAARAALKNSLLAEQKYFRPKVNARNAFH